VSTLYFVYTINIRVDKLSIYVSSNIKTSLSKVKAFLVADNRKTLKIKQATYKRMLKIYSGTYGESIDDILNKIFDKLDKLQQQQKEK